MHPSSRLATIDRHGPKIGWGLCPVFFWGGELGLNRTQSRLGRGYLHTKCHLSPCSRLAATDIGRKLGNCAPLGEWELGPHLTQCRLGRGIPPYQMASWYIQPFGHNRHGPKIGGSAPFLGRGARSPYSTKSPGPRPTSIPSGILIHPTIWPQQIWAENWEAVPLWGGELGPHITHFWATVCKTVRPMLSVRCLSVLSCLWRSCTVAKRFSPAVAVVNRA